MLKRRCHWAALLSRWPVAALIVCAGLSGTAAATTPSSDLTALLRAGRHRLVLRHGALNGDGAPILRQALHDAQFIAIGEQHGTQEVPQFVAAVCRAMAQDGLDALAVEAGPFAVAHIQPWTQQRDGAGMLRLTEQDFPDFIAFFAWKQEFDLLTACETAVQPPPALWGLDQEFLGAPAFLLQSATKAGGDDAVNAAARALLDQCRGFTRESVASGDWKKSCVFRLSDADLARLHAAVVRGGGPHLITLVSALLKTRHIYTQHETGHAYEANRERALLLKANFLTDYNALSAHLKRPPRVLLKFGANHLYRGFDTTNLADLGNFVTEFADGLGTTSLHIAVLGLRGTSAENAGPGKPSKVATMQPAGMTGGEFGFLGPLVAQADADGMTMFDMRPLRSHLASIEPIDRELERLILGYDLVILIPSVRAETDIGQ